MMFEYITKYFTKAQPPPCDEGYVSLHVLCDHCQAVRLDGRTETTWLYEGQDTAADLVARSRQCHLCMLLLSQLDPGCSKNEGQDRQNFETIRFTARRKKSFGPPWDMGKIIVQVDVFTRMFYPSGSIASIILIPYHCKAQV
jgi:hypothetical protein